MSRAPKYRISRRLAVQIPRRWTVYRIWRDPGMDLRSTRPWMAAAPGRGFGHPFATHAQAVAFAAAQAAEEAALVVPVEQEVCS